MAIKRDELRVINQYIPNSKRVVVFDVGAYIGMWTARVLEHHNRITVHAFEPIHHDKFAENLKNEIRTGRVILNPCACYKETCVREMNLYRFKEYNSSFYRKRNNAITGKRMVQCMTIDSYCFVDNIAKIDFLKVDAEGSDYEVLLGAKTMIGNKCVDYIQFEFWDHYDDNGTINTDLVPVFELLKDYDIYGIGFSSEVPITPKTVEKYGNYLAILKGEKK